MASACSWKRAGAEAQQAKLLERSRLAITDPRLRHEPERYESLIAPTPRVVVWLRVRQLATRAMKQSSISPFQLDCVTRMRLRWREAARTVSTRWDAVLCAEPRMRSLVYAAYVAALDAEEAAAAEMALLSHSTA
jgi:hypothetical protein